MDDRGPGGPPPPPAKPSATFEVMADDNFNAIVVAHNVDGPLSKEEVAARLEAERKAKLYNEIKKKSPGWEPFPLASTLQAVL